MTHNKKEVVLTGSEYNQFRDYLEGLSGILLGDGKEYLVASRLRKLMADRELPNLTELMYCMERDRQFKNNVIDAMTTNETLWLRDSHPFEILRNRVFPALAEQSSPIRIWSSACSTGQEPYSIKLTELEFRRTSSKRLPAVSVLATDLSESALSAAKEGTYPWMAIRRGMPEDQLAKYFEKTGDDAWHVGKELRQGVEFRNFNLNDSYSRLGTFDIIFCRNVLIYFSAERKRDILLKMHGALKPGGYLILGASEALSGMPDHYEMVSCNPGILYRKK
ncbi:chemotaxis protein methyltransferase CheR [Thalassolituus maritimus]|uniref:protein-glutamate O-methyltransferase n=1 Tax=Thalassolituus maritimus TaxID=484498 RepID=A0A1N7LPN7_9GAMM|nr:protein-glutamate O-methyltransferase CheR [Thalassolituus maritimus]SIS75661.1 chemotaxis protein methyltransferase CheR [Thalassolituus maritimus]